jgi:MOSC domain-containing protein YiiM
MTEPVVTSVSASATHAFSKDNLSSIHLVKGLGVRGDAHMGETVKHRSRVAADPTQPNLRQVHLIHAELFSELGQRGFAVKPGDLGENITTRGIDLLALPRGTRLAFAQQAIVEITGLRNPCKQIDGFQNGLMEAVLERDAQRGLIRKAGVMGIVIEGGPVAPGDGIRIILPPTPHEPLKPV